MWKPTKAPVKNLRELVHWLWAQFTAIGAAIGEPAEPTDPDNPDPPTDPGTPYDHRNLVNVWPDQHHNQAHDFYGADHLGLNTDTPATTRDILAFDGAEFITERRVNDRGDYVSGQTYYVMDQALEAGYLGIAKVETTDPIAPVTVGDLFWPTEGSVRVDQFQTLEVATGQVYTFAEAGYSDTMGVDVHPDDVGFQHTLVVTINDIITYTLTWTPTASGAVLLTTPGVIIQPGEVVGVSVKVTNSTGNERVYYTEDAGFWTGYTNPLFTDVQGRKDGVLNDNAYGVDAQFIQVTASPDWHRVSGPLSGSSGGGGSFTPTTFAGAGTSGYVADPVTENGYFLRDDGLFAAIPGGGGGATESEITQAGHGLAVLDCVRFNGISWVKAQANDASTTALGVVVAVADADNFTFAMSGRYEIGALEADEWFYLSDTVAGDLTPTEPAISQPIVYSEDGAWVVIYPYRPSTKAADGAMVGEIKPFHGSLANLTPGWHLCDGTNGTPDLRGRSLFGADGGDYVEGDSGGTAPGTDVASDTVGDHNHAGGTTGAGSTHSHTFPTTNIFFQVGGANSYMVPTSNTVTYESSHAHAMGTTGGGGSHGHDTPATDPLHFVITGWIMYTGVA